MNSGWVFVEGDDDLDDADGWGVHFCPFDRDCRRLHGLWRLYVHTPRGSLIVGFTPRSWTQLWLPWKTRATGASGGKSNFSRWWSPIAWHPR